MTTTTKPKLTKIEKTRADSYESHLVWAAQAQIKAERDALAAELAAIKNQEPVAWRMDWINHGPSFTADKSDYVTWFAGKESYPKELVPLFAAPVPELRGVTDAQGLPSMAAPAHTTGESSGHPTPPVQEPVAWRWRMNGQWHYGPEPLFKDGFTTQEPLYDKPIPPVREPLSDEEVDALGDL